MGKHWNAYIAQPRHNQTLNQMVSIVPYYRKDRSTVVVNVFVNRKVAKVVNIGIKIESQQWDEKARRVIDHPNKNLLNQKIRAKINELEAHITKAELLGTHITAQRVKKIAEGNIITTDFYKWATEWIKEKYSNPGTLKQCKSEINKLKIFSQNLSFGDIDFRWLKRYEKHMKEVLHNKGNTPWKSLKFVRTMIYDAQRIGGMVSNNPFQSREFKMPRYLNPEKDGLYISECDKIEEIFSQPVPVVLKIVAAKFLFMCYSGLRISDAKRFTEKEHLREDRIVMKTQKFGVVVDLKIHKRLLSIIDRLRGLPEKKFADQNLNEWLKVLQEQVGFNRMSLTTHCGRHTFGCLLAELDIPIDIAQKLLGHSRVSTTMIYYKLRQKKIDSAIDRFDTL